jgi:hypothetical protein
LGNIPGALNIDDGVMTRLEREATRQGKTMSELVVMALRLLVQSRPRAADLPPLCGTTR